MNIMLVLINVKKVNNILSANYYFEDNKNDVGYIEYNINTGNVIKYIKNEDDKKYNFNKGLEKSKLAFQRMIKYNKFPETYHYIWF